MELGITTQTNLYCEIYDYLNTFLGKTQTLYLSMLKNAIELLNLSHLYLFLLP